MNEFLAGTERYVTTNPWLALVAVFAGGALTASNPCVLAMVPLTMSFVAGQREGGSRLLRALGFSLLFVLGLSITFVAMGALAALAGELYGDVPQAWDWVVAAVCVVMGLHLAGIVHVPIPMPLDLRPRTTGAVGALVLGLLFGVVSAPCAAPILVVLLTYLAGSGASVAYGGLLLLVYALGHSVLILVAGTSMGAAQVLIESKGMTRATWLLRRIAGVVIIAVGAYFAFRQLA